VKNAARKLNKKEDDKSDERAKYGAKFCGVLISLMNLVMSSDVNLVDFW